MAIDHPNSARNSAVVVAVLVPVAQMAVSVNPSNRRSTSPLLNARTCLVTASVVVNDPMATSLHGPSLSDNDTVCRSAVTGRTQIYLGQDEIELLDRP